MTNKRKWKLVKTKKKKKEKVLIVIGVTRVLVPVPPVSGWKQGETSQQFVTKANRETSTCSHY